VPEAIANGLAYVTEDRKQLGLHLGEDIARNITLAALDKVSRRTVVDPHAETVAAEGLRRAMRIKAPNVHEVVGKLSGGNQQKVVLGKWLARDPSLLIIDEPTRGIDVGTKAEVHRIIDGLVAGGMAVLMISSELPEVLGMADRVLVLHEGRLTAELTRAQADEDSVMRAASGLPAAVAA
jgi:ABC-type sugar transport system ATPase subunit